MLSVSIDPREGPDLAAEKKERYVSKYRREGAAVVAMEQFFAFLERRENVRWNSRLKFSNDPNTIASLICRMVSR